VRVSPSVERAEPILEERAVVDWLAGVTGTPPERVAEELDVGERRRAFVVEELLDAGLAGAELLDAVVRLTGLDEEQSRELVREHIT
jgi:hypothetical protein